MLKKIRWAGSILTFPITQNRVGGGGGRVAFEAWTFLSLSLSLCVCVCVCVFTSSPSTRLCAHNDLSFISGQQCTLPDYFIFTNCASSSKASSGVISRVIM